MKVYEVIDKINDIDNILKAIHDNEDVDMDDVSDILVEHREYLRTMNVKENS